MEFQKINEGAVVGENGISIQIKHPEFLEYSDGDNIAVVSIDYDPISKQIEVYASHVDTWKTLSGVEPMSEAKRQQLVEHLTEGLVLLKGKFLII